jgi:putative PIN family toxin of toxin-antitoxin system
MEKHRLIIDTNLWISLLIGKKLSELSLLCNNETLSIYICDELIAEFKKVATSSKIKKYATEQHIADTLQLMEVSCLYESIQTQAVSEIRDAKDLYLLSLADTIHAEYILTGDKDLLILQHHNNTQIVTFTEFMAIYAKY